jgi:hypothetical protein
LHPGCVAVFAFDNSGNHTLFSKDALCAHKMNLGSGGKQPHMRPGIFQGHPQLMLFPNDHPNVSLRGQPKGLKVVLEERGLWPKDRNLLARCQGKCDEGKIDCCAQKIMSLQEDFSAQKSLLVEVIENAGHKCIFYPKFHCEINYIEYFWSAVKRYTRDHCNYTWKGLKVTVPEALASVDLITIQRYHRRAQRFMSAYSKGLDYKAAEYAAKQYKSHRRIPDTITNDYDLSSSQIFTSASYTAS